MLAEAVEIIDPCHEKIIQRVLAVWRRDHCVQESTAKGLPWIGKMFFSPADSMWILFGESIIKLDQFGS